MSLPTDDGWTATRQRAAMARSLAFRSLFGSRLGFVLFLSTLAVAGLSLRFGIFINDNLTLANTLVSLSEGRLTVEEAVYGNALETPGIYVHEGDLYGRNYGQLVFSLPFLWALQGLAAVADPGILFATLWSLLLIALGWQVGKLVERPAFGTSVGAVCGLVAFLGNVAVARPLAERLLALVALQIAAIVATAVAVTLLYRLLARMHGDRVGAVAAVGMLVATPVGFWASIPKRHVFTIALFLGVCYAFYRSRQKCEAGDLLSPLGFRALAYAIVGLTTWLHAGEAFVLFLALVIVDFPTAPSNDWRSLLVVAGAFALSLVPFFATNALISGDLVRPPRMLEQFDDASTEAGFASGLSSTGSGGLLRGIVVTLAPAGLAGPLVEGIDRWNVLVWQFESGFRTILGQPEALYRTFVRGGYYQGITADNHHETIELTVLEAGPVAAALGAAVCTGMVGLNRVVRRHASVPSWRALTSSLRRLRKSPTVATDAFVALTGILFILVYIQQLPIHAQVTVRYLLVLYPIGVYGIARQRPLRRALGSHGRAALWVWVAGVLIGAQLFLLVAVAGSLGLGEAVQVHALAGLAAAVVLAIFASITAVTDSFDRITAGLLGLAAALGTDFLLLSGLVYFQYGQYALPAVGELARHLAVV